MTVDFTQPIQQNPANGSYIVTTQNPAYPYNVLPGDPMWQSIQEWLTAGNKAEEYKPPEAKPVDPDVQIAADIIADFIESQKQLPQYQARLAQLKQQVK